MLSLRNRRSAKAWESQTMRELWNRNGPKTWPGAWIRLFQMCADQRPAWSRRLTEAGVERALGRDDSNCPAARKCGKHRMDPLQTAAGSTIKSQCLFAGFIFRIQPSARLWRADPSQARVFCVFHLPTNQPTNQRTNHSKPNELAS